MKFALLSVLVFVYSATASWAGRPMAMQDAPDCLDHGTAIGVNNDQVLNWKRSTENTFLARGHVHGTVTQIYPDRSGHHHFQIAIGKANSDTIEIIYNEAFGSTPPVEEGMDVEACGDYITSIAQSGPYPPSPDGAILHWVHAAPRPERHPSGYLMINGELYGQDTSHAGFKRRR